MCRHPLWVVRCKHLVAAKNCWRLVEAAILFDCGDNAGIVEAFAATAERRTACTQLAWQREAEVVLRTNPTALAFYYTDDCEVVAVSWYSRVQTLPTKAVR